MAQEVLDPVHYNYLVLGHGQLVFHQGPTLFLCRSAFQLVVSQSPLMHGTSPPQVQDSALPLIELHEIPASPFFQLSQVMSLWIPIKLPGVSTTHPNLLLSAILLSLLSAPTSRSLMMFWETVLKALLKSRCFKSQFHCRRLSVWAPFSSFQTLADYSQPLLFLLHCLKRFFRIICSISFPVTEMRLPGL